MFKKGSDIDKKKLLSKALDVKKDSITRLKHFKTLIEHLDFNEIPLLFKSNFSFIYHTFIDTFSIFDGNSKQRREDLDCILFILEKILIYNPELIKKRWQFFSITFVMQKLLHQNNTWRLRQEGVRLFVLWYQILADETSKELQTMFASIVPGVVPQSQIPASSPQHHQQQHLPNSPVQERHLQDVNHLSQPQLPVKLCSIDPLVVRSSNEQLPNDETSFYLDSLLQFMLTESTKPFWESAEDSRKNQEQSFAFMFNMFKQIYLKNLFTNFEANFMPNLIPKPCLSSHSINQYVDDVTDAFQTSRGLNQGEQELIQGSSQKAPRRDLLNIDLRSSHQQAQQLRSNLHRETTMEQSYTMALSVYQSIVIRWLTRIMRQDTIPGQDELIKTSSGERQDQALASRGNPSSQNVQFSHISDPNSGTIFHNVESTSREMEIARKVTGTYPENIAVIHELFRRAFLNYYQPASMKRVVNVYKEWICNGGLTQGVSSQSKSKFGYSSFGDLLQIFVLNSSNAFVTRLHNPGMLDEQVEMCKRIMNIYRFMVMKIYMNTGTWEQLLNVMLSITEHLFPANPPEKKESTIGGRIAPAFFQTFIVSWIRANLYVHISNRMWDEFHRVMKNLIKWRELIEEWSTTMGSLTRVLVKHVYNLNLTDLPLDKPPDRRRRTRAMKSLSTAEATSPFKTNSPASNAAGKTTKANPPISNRSDSVRLPDVKGRDLITRGMTRSNSDGMICRANSRLYYSSLNPSSPAVEGRLRRIKSEHFLIDRVIDVTSGVRSNSPSHTDAIDGSSLKDPNMIIDHDQVIENQPQCSKTARQQDHKDKCVLLGGSLRGWTSENSVIMWRRMLGLFGNINGIEDPDNHLVAMRCLAVMLCDFIKTRDNQGISTDNQSTPEKPKLVPPYNYFAGWLLEATNLSQQFQRSRVTAYKLLCLLSIRRHDIELPQQFYAAFYEALHRGLTSSDTQVHASIIKNSAHLLSLELPGCTFLVQDFFERSRTILMNSPQELGLQASPRDRAVEILSAILGLNRHIKKLMVLRPEINNPMNLVTPGDIKTKVFETFHACNTGSIILDHQTKCRSLCAMAIQVYQELCDKSNSFDVEKLFDVMMTHLQDSNNGDFFRVVCDLLRLFSDHANTLSHGRPVLVSAMVQTVCQLVVRLSTNENGKEPIHCLLICLEDWCLAVDKSYLMKPVNQLTSEDGTEGLSNSLNESLLTIVLRSLESVINDEQYVEEFSCRGARGSVSTTKGSDGGSHHSQQGSNSDGLLGPIPERTFTSDGSSAPKDIDENKSLLSIKLACKVSHNKISTYLGHFPFRQVGAATMSCLISESDYLVNGQQELTSLKDTSGICLLVINDSTIISFLSVDSSSDHQTRPAEAAHMIIRNICGKYSWEANCIDLDSGPRPNLELDQIQIDPESFLNDYPRSSMKFDPDYNDEGNSSSSLSSRSSLSRDYISDLLNQLSSIMTNSSACSSGQNIYKRRNSAHSVSNPRLRIAQSEETMIALLTNQRFQELNFCDRSDNLDKVSISLASNSSFHHSSKQSDDGGDQLKGRQQQYLFEQCRQFIQQLGYLSWEKRCKIDYLSKNARLLRELKNLDSQPSRETHKIAVIYVANGQEDKNSILSNSTGSRAFEDFTSGLGWEVNLASHLGFKGGLQSNKSTGETSIYYCNSTTEVMYHVSTKIHITTGPADDESLNKKLRHLGNDEVHIVWSEHMRDYRQGIIPTEFGDVIIAIYPMLTFYGYYRIQILSKPDVPLFGPLFDNCIVHQTSLASLVRATAINASRAKRFKLPYYQSHSEERHRLITTIVQNHREELSFEDFAVQLYQSSVIGNPNQAAAGGTSDQGTCCN